jgi:hypothetical protein
MEIFRFPYSIKTHNSIQGFIQQCDIFMISEAEIVQELNNQGVTYVNIDVQRFYTYFVYNQEYEP